MNLDSLVEDGERKYYAYSDRLVETVVPDFIHKDEKGKFIQLVHHGFKQINVIHSKKESKRGGHYHKKNEELFYIIKGKLHLRAQYDKLEESYIFQTGDMFCIYPLVRHEFLFIEETILVSMYNLGVELDNGGKDIYDK